MSAPFAVYVSQKVQCHGWSHLVKSNFLSLPCIVISNFFFPSSSSSFIRSLLSISFNFENIFRAYISIFKYS